MIHPKCRCCLKAPDCPSLGSLPAFSCSPSKEISNAWCFLTPSLPHRHSQSWAAAAVPRVPEALHRTALLGTHPRHHKEGHFCCECWGAWVTSTMLQSDRSSWTGYLAWVLLLYLWFFYAITTFAVRNLPLACGGVLEIFLVWKHHHLVCLLQKLSPAITENN